MSIICNHIWKEKLKTYVLPRMIGGMECSEHLAERILAGLTTIVWECEKCKAIRKEECLGKEK